MTKTEQKQFVRGLSKSIADELCQHIKDGKVPDYFDGHELRAWLADRHEASAAMTSIRREPRKKRAKDYKNWKYTTPGV